MAQALSDRLPWRALLMTLDLVRAAVTLFLSFVSEIWQIYLLIFVLQEASGAFTPAFQTVIPDILSDEEEYTRALSLSRLSTGPAASVKCTHHRSQYFPINAPMPPMSMIAAPY